MSELLARSRSNPGVLADCLIEWTRAESIEARVAAFRLAELAHLAYAFMTGKK